MCVSLSLSLHLSISLYLCLSISLSLYLSISPSLHPQQMLRLGAGTVSTLSDYTCRLLLLR